MADYVLTGNLKREFTFSIDDKDFLFRKPTVREMRTIAKVFSEINSIDSEEEQLARSDDAMAEIYKFISPVNHSESIADVIIDQPVDVQVAFNEMVRKEIGSS